MKAVYIALADDGNFAKGLDSADPLLISCVLASTTRREAERECALHRKLPAQADMERAAARASWYR